MALCPGVASLIVNQHNCCILLWRSSVCYGTAKNSNEEGWVMSQIDLHHAVRFFIIGIALFYVLGPMLRHWRKALPISLIRL